MNSDDEQESVRWLLDTVRDNDPNVLEKLSNKIPNGEADNVSKISKVYILLHLDTILSIQ